MSDIDLLCTMANLDAGIFIENAKLFEEFKGATTEHYVIQKLISQNISNFHYWANESGSAEVDVIFAFENQIIALKIKAAENLQSKSFKTFSQEYPEFHCYRASLSNFRNESWLTNIPLYQINELKRILA